MGSNDKSTGNPCAFFQKNPNRYKARNNTDLKPVPPQLADRTFREQQLIAQVNLVVSVTSDGPAAGLRRPSH